MKLLISDTYEKMSRQAADDVIEMMHSRDQPLICTASGHSPAGLYKEFVERAGKQQLDVSSWYIVGLDEWTGLNGNDEGSCRYHLDHELFYPLQIPPEKICFFDGRAVDLRTECERTEKFIRERGGMDVAILGLGMNGHVGMNEPGTSPKSRSHLSDLDPTTQQVGQKYFKKGRKLSSGVTLRISYANGSTPYCFIDKRKTQSRNCPESHRRRYL